MKGGDAKNSEIGRHHEDIPVGKIDEPQDTVYHGIPNGNQRVQTAICNAVCQVLYNDRQTHSPKTTPITQIDTIFQVKISFRYFPQKVALTHHAASRLRLMQIFYALRAIIQFCDSTIGWFTPAIFDCRCGCAAGRSYGRASAWALPTSA